jgi:hypothetical protein
MVEKNLLIGALVTGIADAALEGYYVYMGAKGTNLRNTFPYYVVPGAEWVPPLDKWITDAGIPALLYVAGKYMKKPALKQMAKGGAVYGVSTLIGLTAVRASWTMQGKSGFGLPMTYQVVR